MLSEWLCFVNSHRPDWAHEGDFEISSNQMIHADQQLLTSAAYWQNFRFTGEKHKALDLQNNFGHHVTKQSRSCDI